jgi:hypothetical protein
MPFASQGHGREPDALQARHPNILVGDATDTSPEFLGASRSKLAAALCARSSRARRMVFCKTLTANQGETSIGRGVGGFG